MNSSFPVSCISHKQAIGFWLSRLVCSFRMCSEYRYKVQQIPVWHRYFPFAALLLFIIVGTLEQSNSITETSFWTRTQRERRMEEAVAVTQELQPWGRFKFVSREPAEESDHLYFYKKTHTIGRNAARADIIIDKLFISASVRVCIGG